MTPDYVTPRELHEKIDHVEAQLADVRLETERRFGRVEKFLALIAAAMVSPKLGGPDATSIASAVVHHLT